MKEKVKQFKEHQQKLHAFEHAINLLTYDAATGMPAGASETLGDTLAVLSEESYKLTVDSEFRQLLMSLNEEKENLDFQTKREVEVLLEEQQKMEKIPKEEVVAAQVAVNKANHFWEEAKKTNDYQLFKPYLKDLIEIKKRFARYINPEEKDIYNTLMNEFEKGMRVEDMDPLFDGIRKKLVPLLEKVGNSKNRPDYGFLHSSFAIDQQKRLSDYVMDVMGVDKTRCTLRETEHPFTTEFSKNDVRITTKYKEAALTSNFYSVIHESGHGLYELGVGDELLHSALGHGATTAIHESQSRLWENCIGRSLPFCQLIFPKVKELFPIQMKGVTAEDLFRAVNIAQPSLIRTEADELTYSLHVMVRYQLEKMIFRNEISVDELPSMWNKLYKEYLGIDVPDDTHGVLQDAHWAGGAFGYFPSYALGTAYSVQIMDAMEKEVDVTACCKAGDFLPVRAWLTEKIYRHGMLYTAQELILNTCGEKFNPDYYINYLTEKYDTLSKE